MAVATGLLELTVRLDVLSEQVSPVGGAVNMLTVPPKPLIEVRVIVEFTVWLAIPAGELAAMLKSVPIVNVAVVVWIRPPLVAFIFTV
jgi:hypothetical protein